MERVEPRVLVLVIDPVVEAAGGQRLNALAGFNDPQTLAAGYAADLEVCSGGYLRYRFVGWEVHDEHPPKVDGFRYTDTAWLAAWEALRLGRGDTLFHRPDLMDYPAFIARHRLADRVNAGEVDEVWVFLYPYGGLWESTLAGPGAFWCNSDPVPGVPARRCFPIMGFNPERGVGEMLENFGHRVESTLTRVYGSWDPAHPHHAWDHFTRYDLVAPGQAACGNVHFAPNSRGDYDWGNPHPVRSTADDWLTYPHLTGAWRWQTAADWGHGAIREHHRWWLSRLPRAPGRGPDGRLANWWRYVIELNTPLP